jgi:hypothetical protein
MLRQKLSEILPYGVLARVHDPINVPRRLNRDKIKGVDERLVQGFERGAEPPLAPR